MPIDQIEVKCENKNCRSTDKVGTKYFNWKKDLCSWSRVEGGVFEIFTYLWISYTNPNWKPFPVEENFREKMQKFSFVFRKLFAGMNLAKTMRNFAKKIIAKNIAFSRKECENFWNFREMTFTFDWKVKNLNSIVNINTSHQKSNIS